MRQSELSAWSSLDVLRLSAQHIWNACGGVWMDRPTDRAGGWVQQHTYGVSFQHLPILQHFLHASYTLGGESKQLESMRRSAEEFTAQHAGTRLQTALQVLSGDWW